MHSIEKIISILIYIIIIPIIIFNLTIMIKSYINPTEIPDFFGLKSFVIVSESMESTIMKGDAIFIKKVNQDELKINDIISFHNKDEIITHRIVKVIEENGKTKYITKGDNNRREDKEHITYEKIEGVYQFKISGFGKIVELLKDKITLIILLIILNPSSSSAIPTEYILCMVPLIQIVPSGFKTRLHNEIHFRLN